MSDTSDPRDMEKAEGDRDTVDDDLESTTEHDRGNDDASGGNDDG